MAASTTKHMTRKPSGGEEFNHRVFKANKVSHFIESYPQYLLKRLSLLWKEELYCDISIIANGKSFSAHRHILAASSSFFKAMFTSGMVEGSQKEIYLHDIDEDIIQELLSFIYTGVIEITLENVQDLLSSSDMLGLVDVTEACGQFLQQHLNTENCIGIYLFCDAHSCQDVKQAAELYIQKHFLQVSKTEEFLQLPKDELIHFLSSENLRLENEIQAFNAAIVWINHDLISRRKEIFDVMKPIRFPIIHEKHLEKFQEECTDISLKIAVHKIIQDYKMTRKLCLELQLSRIDPTMLQPRLCARKNIYVIGGYSRKRGDRWSDMHTLKSVERFDTFHKQWHKLPNMKKPRSGLGAAVLCGKIYIVGGENDSLIHDCVEMFDPDDGKWMELGNMTDPRCGLNVCAFNNCIYAFGGWVGSVIGDTVEKYTAEIDAWCIVGTMPTPRFGMALVETQGLIYVIGGLSEMGTELKFIDSFNPVTKEWVRLTNMPARKAYIGAAAIDDLIYVVGGWNEHEGPLNTVHKYNIITDEWSDVSCLSMRRAGPSVISVDGLLYVIGGRYYSDLYTAPVTTDSVECYDPNTDKWTEFPPMFNSRCEAGVVVL
ncbi:actin-binding protein IPP isoform X1 [Patella vulgata]|uniref:actin-binding protein IPP isoform X1 n=2 Tax=Patella vulgata TaxID=6465 RepID=UPI00217F9628|nr:actin-binding protein IPP isoform X1 [Patella vulgata]